MYRHFQSWNDPVQYRVSYQKEMARNQFTVRIIYCTPTQAERLEGYLILRHQPEDNIKGIEELNYSTSQISQMMAAGEKYNETPADFVPF